MAKSAFTNIKPVLCNSKLSIQTRLRVLKCYVLSVLMYGSETWTVSQAMQQRLEAAEMWFIWRMLKISWSRWVTNERVLQIADTKRSLWKSMVKRRLQFVGHILRYYGLEKKVMMQEVHGKGTEEGRGEHSWAALWTWSSTTTLELPKAWYTRPLSADRLGWHALTAHVLQDMAH